MGFIRRILGGSAGPSAESTGGPVDYSGDMQVDVAGESYYVVNFERLFPRTEHGIDATAQAELVADPSNVYDRNAVRVMIGGLQVGHLNREAAAAFAPTAQRLASQGAVITCTATVRGGWDQGQGQQGNYGVVLWMRAPDS